MKLWNHSLDKFKIINSYYKKIAHFHFGLIWVFLARSMSILGDLLKFFSIIHADENKSYWKDLCIGPWDNIFTLRSSDRKIEK